MTPDNQLHSGEETEVKLNKPSGFAIRPIIFSGPMVRAILEGRKTQTRRLATSPLAKCQVGDRLWVRESFGSKLWDHPLCPDGRKPRAGDQVMYMADPENAHWGSGLPSQGGFAWRPSIHMPRWASRLTLTVTAVRRQPLQAISQDDADAECFAGDFPSNVLPNVFPGGRERWGHLSIPECFGRLWNSLHTQIGETWADNPEIVALTFTVERRNIDAVPA